MADQYVRRGFDDKDGWKCLRQKPVQEVLLAAIVKGSELVQVGGVGRRRRRGLHGRQET